MLKPFKLASTSRRRRTALASMYQNFQELWKSLWKFQPVRHRKIHRGTPRYVQTFKPSVDSTTNRGRHLTAFDGRAVLAFKSAQRQVLKLRLHVFDDKSDNERSMIETESFGEIHSG